MKNKVLKKIAIPLLAASFFVIPMNKPAEAFLGGGITGPLPIFNVDKTVDAATLKQQLDVAEQLSNQIKQLENEARNLDPLDSKSLVGLNAKITNTLQQLQQVNNEMQAIGTDYASLQQQWDETYKDFGNFNGMSGEDYATYNRSIINTTQQKIQRALASQSLASDANIQADITALKQLLANSQGAQGAVAATQAASQIAAMQVEQMLKMQRIMSDSYGAQAIYLQEQAAREKAAQQRAEDFLNTTNQNLRTVTNNNQDIGHY